MSNEQALLMPEDVHTAFTKNFPKSRISQAWINFAADIAQAIATRAAKPAQEPVFCEFCGGNDDDPPQHCMDCARPDRTFTLDQIAAACAEAGVPDSKFEAISIAALRAKEGK